LHTHSRARARARTGTRETHLEETRVDAALERRDGVEEEVAVGLRAQQQQVE
jgi:hypothetical protein